MKKILLFVLAILFTTADAQEIQMYFPHFKGKTYNFVIFRGSDAKVVIKDTIPQDGKFTLKIPKEYAPYTGMSRWLITGTQEGGGLDMLIPGHDFSVKCTSAKPDNDNIIYTDNVEIPELNLFYKKQSEIFARHDAMLQATKAFTSKDKNYSVYEQEYRNQLKAYERLQDELKKKNDYASKFLPIVNLTQGIGTKIYQSEEEKARNAADYITNELDWEVLYTSGHWSGVITSWVDIHTLVLNNPKKFAADFSEINKKITDPDKYTDLVKRIAFAVNKSGEDRFLAEIAPIVAGSGKVTSYDGLLAAYVSGTQGNIAPDLTLSPDGKMILKSSNFSGKEYRKTLLIFYKSDCGSCIELLRELSVKYEQLKSAGVRIISFSADEDETVFKNKTKDFLWKDFYTDLKGLKGINFKNYGVVGTPTLFLIDRSGKIELRTATLREIEDQLK
ncbi:peroxiredoxin family protein [Chryseobacterium limigenitum]|uniref:Peroxiredoxin n=1 Tax=Chryseobacterium limigenitum TaxID=1612149 RepID=A0A1K2IXH6_9FLAO|nr:thioredoxin family protein [Chryseobacterium limigenitum]SFZ97055.1 Peroxiredoxin [Chryseobacterium limigenitum]